MHWIKWITFVNIFMKNDSQFCLNFCTVFFRSDSQKWSMPNHRRRRWLSYTSSCVTMRHHVSHKSQTYYWPLKDKVKACFLRTKLIIVGSQIFLKFLNYFFVPYGWAYLNICLYFGFTDICRPSMSLNQNSPPKGRME